MAIKRGSKVDMNSSSSAMTDLMFQLLIFLMIATTMINPNALKLILPKSSTHSKEKQITTVSIDSDLQYFVEMEQVPFADLEGALQARLQGVEKPSISLHADESVPVGLIVKVMNIARNNKYMMVLATSPE